MSALSLHLEQFLAELMHKPLLGLLFTLVTYQAALWLYQHCNRNALLHPITTCAMVITPLLHWSGISYPEYVAANEFIYFLLGPTTVALAIPLYNEFHHIRKLALPLLVTVLVGSVVASVSAVGIAWFIGADTTTLLSLAPKSVTTPIAIGIAENIGALTTLTTGIVVFTGVIGGLMSPIVFYLLRLRDERLQGIVLGLNAHGVGTAKSFEISPSAGAFATLSMGLTGTFTALVLPYIVALF